MKNNNIFIKACYGFFAVIMCFVSCAKDNELEDGITASKNKATVPSEILLDGNGDSKTINIDADCEWSFTNVPSWITLSNTNGDGSASVEITPSVNPSSTEQRKGSILFNASDRSKTIILTQGVANESLELSVQTLPFDNMPSSSSFAIKSNGSWKITGEKEWLSLDKTEGTGDGNVKVTVQENTSEEERRAELIIQGSQKNQTMTVVQKGREVTLALSTNSITFSATESTVSIIAEGTAKWTASTSDTWITLDKSVFEGSATSVKTTIMVTCKDNPSATVRTGEVVLTYSNGTKSLKCTVKQDAGKKAEVGTTTFSEITKNSAKATASYTSDFPVTVYGFYYSKTNTTPGENDMKVELTGSDKSGSFSATLTGLKSGSEYYVRAYANNGVGYSYGEVTTVTTSGDKPENNDNPNPNL